jgi:hypothetical protein
MTSDELNPGGGAGGGTGMDDSGNNLQSASSAYQIAGNQVVLLSRQGVPLGNPKAKPGPSQIVILAAGGLPTFDDGKVDMRGGKGVRITTGSPIMIPLGLSPKVTDDGTDGVEVIVADKQKITIHRGSDSPPPAQNFFQSIEMTPDSLTLQSGGSPTSFSKVVMKPDTITMQCDFAAGEPPGPKIEMTGGADGWLLGSIKLSLGQSSITIDDTGVTIKGLMVALNPPG